jgi:hypothetical protein
VESYDEETYVCKAGDSFEAISQRYFQSPNYAQALLLFNRNHPRAAAALWKNSATLTEGMPVYVPPLRILEKYHGSAIPGLKPVSAAAPVVPAAAASVPAARVGPQYVVRKSEMISGIAREALGNFDRWSEIYKLNNRIDPSRPLAIGTVLSMPEDARIPAENRP